MLSTAEPGPLGGSRSSALVAPPSSMANSSCSLNGAAAVSGGAPSFSAQLLGGSAQPSFGSPLMSAFAAAHQHQFGASPAMSLNNPMTLPYAMAPSYGRSGPPLPFFPHPLPQTPQSSSNTSPSSNSATTSSSGSSSNMSTRGSPTHHHQQLSGTTPTATNSINRSQRCGVCRGCQCKPCGVCTYCQDSPQFGGPGVKKQSCIERRCLRVLENRLQREAPTFKARVGCGQCDDCHAPDCLICLVCQDKRFFNSRYMAGALCAKKRCNSATSLDLPPAAVSMHSTTGLEKNHNILKRSYETNTHNNSNNIVVEHQMMMMAKRRSMEQHLQRQFPATSFLNGAEAHHGVMLVGPKASNLTSSLTNNSGNHKTMEDSAMNSVESNQLGNGEDKTKEPLDTLKQRNDQTHENNVGINNPTTHNLQLDLNATSGLHLPLDTASTTTANRSTKSPPSLDNGHRPLDSSSTTMPLSNAANSPVSNSTATHSATSFPIPNTQSLPPYGLPNSAMFPLPPPLHSFQQHSNFGNTIHQHTEGVPVMHHFHPTSSIGAALPQLQTATIGSAAAAVHFVSPYQHYQQRFLSTNFPKYEYYDDDHHMGGPGIINHHYESQDPFVPPSYSELKNGVVLQPL